MNDRIIRPVGEPAAGGLRERIFIVIFGHETPAGKAFDVCLIMVILLSVTAVMLDTVDHIHMQHGHVLYMAEWIFTILFTVEYLVRIWVVKEPRKYIFSFYGIIDLLSVIPTYLSLLLVGAQYMLVIRVVRILRVFRVLKLMRYMREANVLLEALRSSSRKIVVFLYGILTLVVIFGSLMYLVEGPENGFTSIPRGVYWAIVTLTTVGYGDISPHTPLGQAISAVIMILGYGIIAVPTGIYAAELTQGIQRARTLRECSACGRRDHAADARFCRHCGGQL